MVFFLIFDILCLLASLGMSVLVALVISFWGTVNDELRSCVTSQTFYGQDRCTCTRRQSSYPATFEKSEMGKSTFFEIYPDQV